MVELCSSEDEVERWVEPDATCEKLWWDDWSPLSSGGSEEFYWEWGWQGRNQYEFVLVLESYFRGGNSAEYIQKAL